MAQALANSQSIETVRIFRLAAGIALALAFSQAINWPAAFIVPLLASVLLTLPLPAPTPKFALGFVLVVSGSLLLGLLLLPMLHYQPAAGVLLISLGVFACFYFGASGGSSALVTFLLLGFTVIPLIGSESIDGALMVSGGLIVGAVIAFLFIWLAYAIFPDPVAGSLPVKQKPEKPNPDLVLRSALRSSVIVLPVLQLFFFVSDTSAYAAALIKIATMGQQGSHEDARSAGRDLLLSTLIGGVAAVSIWNVLQIWPTLLIYSLLFLLCGLIMGPKIFSGQGMAPQASVWSYGLLTMMVIVAPAAMDSAGGDAAGSKFFDRITMFVVATFYAVTAVYLFDQLWPDRSKLE